MNNNPNRGKILPYHAKWEKFVLKDRYYQENHPNLKIWFTVGDDGDHYVSMHSGVIDNDFNPESLLFENATYNEETDQWKTTYNPEVPSYVPDHIARLCNKETLVPALQRAYNSEYPSVSLTKGQGVIIKGVFDMNDVNEYGVAKDLYDDIWGN